MLPETRRVVSPKEFDKVFREEAVIAEFSSSQEEEEYERRDSALIRLIRKEIRRHIRRNADQPFVSDDWWPNHTRYIDVTPEHCTAPFLNALGRLLNNDYKDYRIQICVYEDMTHGGTYIGSMALYKDRVLIEKKLHSLFQTREALP
jgi:hypothetical protein